MDDIHTFPTLLLRVKLAALGIPFPLHTRDALWTIVAARHKLVEELPPRLDADDLALTVLAILERAAPAYDPSG